MTISIADVDKLIGFSSPVLYMVFVELCKFLPKINAENKALINFMRQIHNISLAIASFALFVSVTYVGWKSSKFDSLHSLICGRFTDEELAGYIGRLFYLSKYWEWIDTTFLIIANKEVSWLQYTHHMSTAIMVYVNIVPIISSASLYACFANAGIHTIMYYYFAFPKSFLRHFRQLITSIQIVQHFFGLYQCLYIYLHFDDCYSSAFGNYVALFLYSVYLVFFVLFYFVQYVVSGSGKDTQKAAKKLQ